MAWMGIQSFMKMLLVWGINVCWLRLVAFSAERQFEVVSGNLSYEGLTIPRCIENKATTPVAVLRKLARDVLRFF